jgi:hypothetical protein
MIDPQRASELADYANAQPMTRPPGGHAVARAPTIADSIVPIGAQPVAVMRDDQKILQKISVEAAAASDNWFYRFPVRSKESGQAWIEGASIKLANSIARIYGNNSIETRVLDYGDSWLFLSRFSDFETGFSMERAFQQRKSQTSLKTKDYERQQDIAFQIGQSKAIRNVIVNALGTLCDYALEQARNSLVERVGKDLDGWRQRTIDAIARMPLDLRRVERVIGRTAKDWLAPDVARVIAMMRAVADGMASADETFPPIEAPPPAEKTTPAPSEPAAASSPEQPT